MRDLRQLFAASTRSLERNVAQVEREVQRIYRETFNEIRDELGRIFDRYSVDGVLTRAEMTKYNRLAKTERELNTLIGRATQRTRAANRRLQVQQYNESFFRHAWAIEQNIGVRIAWGGVPSAAVEAMVNNDLKLIAESRLRNLGRERIRRSLAQGLVRGDSFPKMAREIREVIDGTAADAMRITRTEGLRAMTQGELLTYDRAEEAGIEGRKVWVASLDDRTRQSHRDMDGRIADDDGRFTLPSGVHTDGPRLSGEPEEDINCRCTLIYQIEGLAPELRRIRDEGVQPYQTYNEWAGGRNIAA